jgi:hypothetical protein
MLIYEHIIQQIEDVNIIHMSPFNHSILQTPHFVGHSPVVSRRDQPNPTSPFYLPLFGHLFLLPKDPEEHEVKPLGHAQVFSSQT